VEVGRLAVEPARDRFLFLGPMSPVHPLVPVREEDRRAIEPAEARSSAGPLVPQCRASVMVYDEINDEATAD
jgi:hypothetical protein